MSAPDAASGAASAAAVVQAFGMLRGWLGRTVSPGALAWLEAEIDRQRKAPDESRFAMSLSLAGRKVGAAPLEPPADELPAARALRRGWEPERWSAAVGARTLLLLSTYDNNDDAFASRIERLCASAEISEHVAYLKGHAVFPAGMALCGRAREAVRSSSAPVFEAIACHNPYPRDFFDEAAWNQMVVKCVFVGAPIEGIVGLDERRNPDLIRMLSDFVSERHAAGRPLPETVHQFIEG